MRKYLINCAEKLLEPFNFGHNNSLIGCYETATVTANTSEHDQRMPEAPRGRYINLSQPIDNKNTIKAMRPGGGGGGSCLFLQEMTTEQVYFVLNKRDMVVLK